MRQVNIVALLAALDAHRAAKGLSWREVARATGLSASMFSRMASGHHPDLDGYAICCRWLGISMDTFASPPMSNGQRDLSGDLVALFSRHGVPEVYWRALIEHIATLNQE